MKKFLKRGLILVLMLSNFSAPSYAMELEPSCSSTNDEIKKTLRFENSRQLRVKLGTEAANKLSEKVNQLFAVIKKKSDAKKLCNIIFYYSQLIELYITQKLATDQNMDTPVTQSDVIPIAINIPNLTRRLDFLIPLMTTSINSEIESTPKEILANFYDLDGFIGRQEKTGFNLIDFSQLFINLAKEASTQSIHRFKATYDWFKTIIKAKESETTPNVAKQIFEKILSIPCNVDLQNRCEQAIQNEIIVTVGLDDYSTLKATVSSVETGLEMITTETCNLISTKKLTNMESFVQEIQNALNKIKETHRRFLALSKKYSETYTVTSKLIETVFEKSEIFRMIYKEIYSSLISQIFQNQREFELPDNIFLFHDKSPQTLSVINLLVQPLKLISTKQNIQKLNARTQRTTNTKQLTEDINASISMLNEIKQKLALSNNPHDKTTLKYILNLNSWMNIFNPDLIKITNQDEPYSDLPALCFLPFLEHFLMRGKEELPKPNHKKPPHKKPTKKCKHKKSNAGASSISRKEQSLDETEEDADQEENPVEGTCYHEDHDVKAFKEATEECEALLSANPDSDHQKDYIKECGYYLVDHWDEEQRKGWILIIFPTDGLTPSNTCDLPKLPIEKVYANDTETSGSPLKRDKFHLIPLAIQKLMPLGYVIRNQSEIDQNPLCQKFAQDARLYLDPAKDTDKQAVTMRAILVPGNLFWLKNNTWAVKRLLTHPYEKEYEHHGAISWIFYKNPPHRCHHMFFHEFEESQRVNRSSATGHFASLASSSAAPSAASYAGAARR
jgi:hypothetical protein